MSVHFFALKHWNLDTSMHIMLCDVSGLLQEETLVSRYLCVAPESDDQKRHY